MSADRPAPAHLFVYGTLRSDAGSAAHRQRMRRLRLIGPATVAGRLHHAGRYPAAVPSGDPHDRIAGELYAVDRARADALLASLDEYEGCDPADPGASLFLRATTEAATPDGRTADAWIYWYARPASHLPRIPSGDWLAASSPERTFEKPAPRD